MAKKTTRKSRGQARKRVKTANLPAKTLRADDVRAVKGGGTAYSKISLEYKPQPDATTTVTGTPIRSVST